MSTCWGQIITEDLVVQILPLLPSKSQARFKSVSKQWQSLISNDPRPVRALLLDCGYTMHLLPLDAHQHYPIFHQQHSLQLLQSCNGLLLLQRCGHFGLRYGYLVYNPLTRQHAALPARTCCFDRLHVDVTASLAYDPLRSPHYKLLCLGRYYINIYSSLTSRWTYWDNLSFKPVLGGIVDSYFHRPGKKRLFWNGSVYYISDTREVFKLYRFDIDREVMVRTPLPRDGFKTGCFKRLVESWGRLYFLGSVGEEVKVYEMESDHSGWRLKYRLDDFGRDLNLRFGRSRNDLKIRLGGGKVVRVPIGRYEVFFPTPESGGEEEMWLVVLDGMLVYRYGLGSKSVVVVKARHHCQPYRICKVHEFAESILKLP